MKFLKQVVLPIAVLLGLIAGLTFVTHYTGSPRKGTGHSALPTGPVQAAVFPLEPVICLVYQRDALPVRYGIKL